MVQQIGCSGLHPTPVWLVRSLVALLINFPASFYPGRQHVTVQVFRIFSLMRLFRIEAPKPGCLGHSKSETMVEILSLCSSPHPFFSSPYLYFFQINKNKYIQFLKVLKNIHNIQNIFKDHFFPIIFSVFFLFYLLSLIK